MDTRNDGIKIMLWTFSIFFILAWGAIELEDYMEWNKPDLLMHYSIENGKIVQTRKGV